MGLLQYSAKVNFPSLDGRGQGEAGVATCRDHSCFPLSLTLSRKGRGNLLDVCKRVNFAG